MKSTGSGADFTAPITPGHQSEKGIAILQSTGRDVEVAVTRLDELSAARLSFGVQNLNAD